jgi:hypothetical protein
VVGASPQARQHLMAIAIASNRSLRRSSGVSDGDVIGCAALGGIPTVRDRATRFALDVDGADDAVTHKAM